MRKHLKSLLCIAALTAAGAASAQKAGDDIVSIGIASINPSTSLGTMTATSSDPTTAGYFTSKLVGASANVGSQSTVSFGWLHLFTDNIGAEFTIGVPATFTQDLYTPNGSTAAHPGAAQMKIWTPTAIGKYFFGTAQDQWRPYVGFGISYVSFHNVSVNSGDPMVAALANTSASFDSAWTPVYNAGLIYNIDDKWSINGSVSYLPIKTTVHFAGPGSPLLGSYPVTTTGDAKLNTTDYVIRLGYRF